MAETETTSQTKAALKERVKRDFALQTPKTPEVGLVLDELRREFTTVGLNVIDLTPASREQSLALTKLEEALQHAIGAVVRHQDRQ